MKSTVATLKFLGVCVAVGLALAFVLVWVRPDILLPDTSAESAQHSPGGDFRTSFSQAVSQASPAVVNIYANRLVTERRPARYSNPAFERFFGARPLSPPIQRLESSLGSGVIVDSDGHIITNYHVIAEASDIQVALSDGRIATPEIVGIDQDTDLAILRIDVDNTPVAHLGSSSDISVGDVVLAIGNPFGIGQTVTMGIVSATGRGSLNLTTFEDFIQTDAAINDGSSGGALVDPDGAVVGINTAMFNPTMGAQGIGFAIPIDLALDVLGQIVDHGQVVRGWLGVRTFDPRYTLATGAGTPMGLVVSDVAQGGPADSAGINRGDTLLRIDGVEIVDERSLLQIEAESKPGQTVQVTAQRGNRQYSTEATLAQRPIGIS